MSFLPNPWLILGAFLAVGGAFLAGIEVESRNFASYRGAQEAIAKIQEDQTKRIAAQHRKDAEDAQAQSQTLAADRDAAIAKLRVVQSTIAGRSIVPAPAPGAPVSDRVCYSRAVLDRELRATVARAAERLVGIAQEGQRGWDLAVVCRDWAKALR